MSLVIPLAGTTSICTMQHFTCPTILTRICSIFSLKGMQERKKSIIAVQPFWCGLRVFYDETSFTGTFPVTSISLLSLSFQEELTVLLTANNYVRVGKGLTVATPVTASLHRKILLPAPLPLHETRHPLYLLPHFKHWWGGSKKVRKGRIHQGYVAEQKWHHLLGGAVRKSKDPSCMQVSSGGEGEMDTWRLVRDWWHKALASPRGVPLGKRCVPESCGTLPTRVLGHREHLLISNPWCLQTRMVETANCCPDSPEGSGKCVVFTANLWYFRPQRKSNFLCQTLRRSFFYLVRLFCFWPET